MALRSAVLRAGAGRRINGRCELSSQSIVTAAESAFRIPAPCSRLWSSVGNKGTARLQHAGATRCATADTRVSLSGVRGDITGDARFVLSDYLKIPSCTLYCLGSKAVFSTAVLHPVYAGSKFIFRVSFPSPPRPPVTPCIFIRIRILSLRPRRSSRVRSSRHRQFASAVCNSRFHYYSIHHACNS